jgi:hypothetical protein
MARLRKLLSRPPSVWNWSTLLRLLEHYPQGHQRTLAQEYALNHLKNWPDSFRELHELNPQHPGWPLATSIRLHECELSDEGFVQLQKASHLTTVTLVEGSLAALDILRGLPHLRHLRCLRLVNAWDEEADLLNFETFRDFPPLLSLELHSDIAVHSLTGLESLASLRQLHLHNLASVESLQPLSALRHVQTLSLGHADEVQDWSPLSTLPVLTSLSLQGLHGHWSEMTGWSALPGLQELSLCRCAALDASGLETLPSLSSVTIRHCPLLEAKEG